MGTSETEYMREVDESMKDLRGGSTPPIDTLERLYRLGVWSRGSILPRGTLSLATANRLPDPNEIELIVFWLESGPSEIRRKAALVVGQWGGKECIAGLRKVLTNAETDSVTRRYCICALRNIGGPEAVAAVIGVMKSRDSEVQDAAISALVDLATGGSPSDIDSITDLRVPVGSAQALSAESRIELEKALDDIQKRDSTPLALRFRAAEAFAFLSEIGVLGPVEVPVAAAAIDLSAPLYGGSREALYGGPKGNQAPKSGTKMQVPWLRPDGGKQEVEIEILPPDEADRLQSSEDLCYLGGNQRVIVTLRIYEQLFPKGVAALHVSAVSGDGTLVPPDASNATVLIKEDGARTFEFAMPAEALPEWLKRPRFLLTAVEEKP